MKNQNLFTVQVKNGTHGLDIYLDISGRLHYVTSRRASGLLWVKLKGGVTLGELRRFKPQNTRFEQMYYHTSRYLLKILEEYLRYDMPA